jgi:preprotein translocase subunit SecD
MNKRIRTRLLITLGVTVLSVLLFAGFPPSLAKMREKINLGLDLRGGTHLVLQVVTEDAIRLNTDGSIESFRMQLGEENIVVRQITRTADNEFRAIGVDPTKDGDVRRILNQNFPDWDLVSTAGEVPNTYTIRLKPNVGEVLRDQAVEQALQTIRNRVDELGVAEPTLQKHGGPGEFEILVQLPGMTDPARVKNIIKSTALLELKMVENGPFSSQGEAAQSYGGVVPGNLEILRSGERGLTGDAFYVVQRVAAVSGRDLKGAYPSRDENGRPAVSFNLSADGASRFGRLTGENIGRRLAIVLDGVVQSAPTINGRITDQGIITGGATGFAPQEAQDLALVLRSGALPASMNYLEERVVGPSLGADSIRKGLYASIAALIGVVVFMLFYYRWAGVNAAISMALNLIILFGALAYFGATLTLPGIAGVILTIGVGIDSNVLIFERIREELKAGKTSVGAITAGFQRVFTTIVDTHLAALISAMFLFLFGTGPVKGFAVTLVIGLVANVFTAVFVSRTLFDWTLSRRGRAEATLSI